MTTTLENFERLYREEIAKYDNYEEWAEAHCCQDIWFNLMEYAGFAWESHLDRTGGTEPPPEYVAIMDKVDMERFGKKTSDEY